MKFLRSLQEKSHLVARSFGPMAISTLLIASSLGGSAQVSVTATAGTPGPANYATVNAAFAAINAGTHQGVIDLKITGSTIEPTTATALLSSGTGASLYTSITIMPTGNVIVQQNGSTSRSILEFMGADNVTLDGDDPLTPGERNLTLKQVGSAVGSGVVRFRNGTIAGGSDGTVDCTIKNCILVGGRISATSTANTYGIYAGSTLDGQSNSLSATPTSGCWGCTGLTIENNEIRKCYYGIFIYGASGSYPDGLVIRDNDFTSPSAAEGLALRGILLSRTQGTASANSALIEGNTFDMWSLASSTMAAVELADGNAGAMLLGNRINRIFQGNTSTSYGAHGISLTSASSNDGIRIANNFIQDLRNRNSSASVIPGTISIPAGIRIAANATNIEVLHNTVTMTGQNTNPAAPSQATCLQITTTLTGAVVRNNIFSNTMTSPLVNANTRLTCVLAPNATPATFSNNDYYVTPASPAHFVAWVGGDRPTLLDWTPAQTGSISEEPPFVSTADVHLSPSATNYNSFLGAGASGTGVLVDIDGDPRAQPPTLGADEVVCSGPAPTVTVSGGGTFCSDQLPAVVFTFTGTAPFNFSYSDGSNTITPPPHPTNTFTLTGAGTGTYTVTALMDALSCVADALGGSVTLMVVPAANPGTDGTLTICLNDPPTSLFNLLGDSAETGGTWTGPSVVTGGLFDPATMTAGAYTYTVPAEAPCTDASATATVVVDPCVGIEEHQDVRALHWTDLDDAGHYMISLENGQLLSIEVHDIHGRRVQATVSKIAADRSTLDLSGNAAGIYMVGARTDLGMAWVRLVHGK